MAGYAAVLVDNRQFVRCLRLREGESGVLNLTTMLPRQDQAYIEIYVVNGRSRQLIHSFHATGLLRDDRRPEIVVSGHLRDTLEVTLRVDGELIDQASIALPSEATRNRLGPVLWPLLVAALLTLLCLGIWWWFTGSQGRPSPAAFSTRSNESRLLAEGRIEPGAGEHGRESLASDASITLAPGPEEEAADSAESNEQMTSRSNGQGTSDSDSGATEVIEIGRRWSVFFQPESSVLSNEAIGVLGEIAAAISQNGVSVRFEGHTALYGNEPARLALSAERAETAARQVLLTLRPGLTTDIATEGYGGENPITRNQADQWRNRRVDIVITGVATPR